MNESREQVIESIVKTILEQASKDDYSYDDWSSSKKQIKELCELSTPINLRYVIWKHIVQQGDQGFIVDNVSNNNNRLNSSTDSNSSSTSSTNITSPNSTGFNPTPIFHNETLLRDCFQLTQDYNLLSQIKSFNNTSPSYSYDSFTTINNNNNKSNSSLLDSSLDKLNVFDNTPVLQPLNSSSSSNNNNLSPLMNSIDNNNNNNNNLSSSTSSTTSIQSQQPNILTTESISERLVRFVRYFCTKTKREYSIDVTKLMIPFVVLSIVEEINNNLKSTSSSSSSTSTPTISSPPSILNQNPSEQDWMALSFKLIESISSSGIYPYQIANPILLCESEMFRILLLYHDPILSHFLNQRTVNSMHYFYEWINHMFCGCIDIKFLISIWDLFLFHNNQDFYIYFALALIISKREATLAIVKGNAKDILQVLEEKNIVNSLSNQIKLPGLIKKAEALRACTPLTFIRSWNKFYTYVKHPVAPKLESIKLIYLEYKYAVCMGIDVEELILNSKIEQQQNNGSNGNCGSIRDKFNYYCQDDQMQEFPLFVFDCRPYKHYKSGKHPGAFHLPPGLLVTQPDEFQRVTQSFLDMKGVTHFTFYDNWQQFNSTAATDIGDADTNDNGDMNMNILKFLKEGFPYVSKVSSGYKKIHDIFLSKGLELAVHFVESCPVCSPGAFNNILPSSPAPSTPVLVDQTPREKWISKLKSLTARKNDNAAATNNNNTSTTSTTATATTSTTATNNTNSTSANSSTTQSITALSNGGAAVENNDSLRKAALGFFRDKLKIRDRASIYDNTDQSINNNNSSGASTPTTALGSGNITGTPSSLKIGSNRTPIKQPQQSQLIDLDSINLNGINTNNGNKNNNNKNSSSTQNITKSSLLDVDEVIISSNSIGSNSYNENSNGLLSSSNKINTNNIQSPILNHGNNLNNNNNNNNLNSSSNNNNDNLNNSGNNNNNSLNSSINNNSNNSATTSQTNLLSTIWNQGKSSAFYLPNLSPFIKDFEEDEDEVFEEGKKYYYYIDGEKDYQTDGADEFFYDREKIQKEEAEAEKELDREYKGIEVWLGTCDFLFECIEKENKSSKVDSSNSNGATTSDIASTASTASTSSSAISTSTITNKNQNRFIIITDKDIIALKEHPIYSGYVKIDYQYTLNSIHRISYKKSNPNLLGFSFSQQQTNNQQEQENENSQPQPEDIIKKSYIFNEIDPILKAINKSN